MWALVINPISGQGKGTTVGNHVAGYLNQCGVDFTIVSGNSSRDLNDHLRIFLENNSDCRGVIAVGGDGLMHLILQAIVPLNIPFSLIPAGTGNDFQDGDHRAPERGPADPADDRQLREPDGFHQQPGAAAADGG